MMRFAIHIVWLLLILLSACNPEKKSRQQIERLEKFGEDRKYEVGIACMQYILKHGDDREYSKALVGKLLDLNFPAESIQAVDRLLEKYPDDPELFCFRGIAYRRLHQYALSQKDMALALRLEPDNATFIREKDETAKRYGRWLEIQSLDSALTSPVDSFSILLSRAEHFYALQEYDAVLYDLGSISKMRATEDSIYYTRKVSSLYSASGKPPVETLSEMLAYFKGLER